MITNPFVCFAAILVLSLTTRSSSAAPYAFIPVNVRRNDDSSKLRLETPLPVTLTEARRSENSSQGYPQWSGEVIRNDDLAVKGFNYGTQHYKQVLMVNGTTDDTFILSFYPEQGKSSSDYEFVFVSNSSEILNSSTDISYSMTESADLLNVTVALDFNKFPGLVRVTAEARKVSDGSLFDSAHVDYLAAGLAVYESETRILISGAGRSLTISSYEDTYKKQHWEFGVFVQYLNSTNSSNVLDPLSSPPYLSISDITPTFMSYEGQVLWDSSLCSVSGGEWDGRQVTLKSGCGVGFANGYVNSSYFDGLHFAYDFEKNRAGKLDILFEWEDFTAGTEFEYEEYTNYILVQILGQPPSVVKQIQPDNPFDPHGGEELYVEMINTVDVNITSFNVNGVPFYLKPGSRQFFRGPTEFFESAKFVTEAGRGKHLPWTISGTRERKTLNGDSYTEIVSFVDETDFLFSYDEEGIFVFSLSPSTVSEYGGEIIVLTGNFTSFDAANPNHSIFIGNVELNKSRLIAASSSSIEITCPPRYEIGAGWEYDIIVRIGNSFSLPIRLSYEPSSLSVRQQVFGASADASTGIFTVSSCDSTTYTTLLENFNGANASFSWRLLNSSNFDLLRLPNASLLVKDTNMLELPNKFIPLYNTLYRVVADISVGNLSTTSVYPVIRTERIVVGVSIVEPENRTISSPPVNMRIIAKIELPECYDDPTSLIYEWQYEDKLETLLTAERTGIFPLSVHDANLEPRFNKYVWSAANTTGTSDEIITPTRLGRELVVPREYLRHGLHRIRLTVLSANDPRLYGTSGTSVTIKESQLSAVIGTGQVSRRASDAQDLYMSAQASSDPDVIAVGDSSRGLSFEWSCKFSIHRNLGSSQRCEESLLPASAVNSSAFIVTSAVLKNHSRFALEDLEGEVYVEYLLRVRKENRTSSTSQKVVVVSTGELKLANYDRVELLNSLGERLNPHAVPFWEEVIIRPFASSSTEWRFRLEKPLNEKSQFFASNSKLISSPGYYTIAGRSDPEFQRLPLGIKADQLSPHQEYVFSVFLQEPGKLSDEVLIGFKTVEVPLLIFPEISRTNGTMSTIFRISATTSFLGNAWYSYQFYLMDVGNLTREYCVDGCTGANTVRFQVARPGRYVLQCRLLAANGKKLLAVKNNSAIISISAFGSVSQVDQFDKEMNRDFLLGDDGGVNQKGFYITESIHEQNEKVLALSDDPKEETCANYTRKWAKLSRMILGNELPNTANARNYISLAANFARLKCIEDLDTLYELLGIVDESISRTPSEETLTTETYSGGKGFPNVQLEEELLRFYNFSMTRALSAMSAGMSRGRLVPIPGEVNNLILDLAEMWMRHITTTATSGRVCGWDAIYASDVVDGESDETLTPDSSEHPLGMNTVRVAVMCNKEQGTSLSTPFSSFHWCDSMYDFSSTERMLITIAELFDYPYLSGVRGMNRSETARIVMVDITTLGESNRLVSAMADSAIFAQAESGGEDTPACYRVGLTMAPEAMTRSDECSRNIPYYMWPRKTYGTAFSFPFHNRAYERRTAGVGVTAETRNDSATVIATSNILGLYGAYRTTCAGSALGVESLGPMGMTLAGIMIGILIIVFIITGLTYALVVAVVRAVTRSHDEEDDMLENYVERDFFGRGQVRLNFVEDDEASVSDESSEANTTEQGKEMENVLEDLDSMVDREGSIMVATKSNLPQEPQPTR